MIKYIIIFIFLFFVTLPAQVKLLQHSSKNIGIEFQLSGVSRDAIKINGKSYRHLDYDGARMIVKPGAPLIPFTIARIAIPPGAAVTSQFQIGQQSELTNIDIVPAVIVNGLKQDYQIAIDNSIYDVAAPYPGQIVEVSAPYIYRRIQVVDVRIYPIQYHPAQDRVRVIEKLSIRININGGKITNGNPPLTANDFDHLNARLLNFPEAKHWIIDNRTGLQKSRVNYDLSTGRWYKIPITEEGVYQITGSFLQSKGIDISDITTGMIQMFNYGGAALSTNVAKTRPADLNELAIEVIDSNNDGNFDPDDTIYFYGTATEGWQFNGKVSPPRWEPYLNPYSFTNYYLITFNQNTGKRIPSQNSPQFNNPTLATRFIDLHRFEEENYNILQSGLDWYWFRYQGTSEKSSHTIRLPQNILPDNAVFKARLKGGSGSRYFDTPAVPYRYTFDISINGNVIVDNEGFSDEFSRQISRDITGLRDGDNEIQISYTGNQEGCFAYLDFLELRVQRQFIAEDGYLKFYYDIDQAPTEFTIANLPSSDNRIWDISDFVNIYRIIPLNEGNIVTFHAHESMSSDEKQYYVFSSSAVKPVGEISALENSPNLRNPDRKAKLILILPDEFYEAAAGWEDFKETYFPGRIETERVKLSEIYKEFSSYVPDPVAIRDFIKYAYENWGAGSPETRVQYVQFLGDGSYDYRNIELTDYVNRVPVFEVTANNDIASRVTDNFFTAINNSFDDMQHFDPQLAIARLPANSTGDIENYLRKIRAYAESFLGNESVNGWQTVLTFVADDECAGSSACNEWFHLRQTEGIVRLIPDKFDLKKIYLTDYDTQAGGLGRQKPKASADLLDQVNRGTLMINYFGHGDPNTWAHEQVLNKARDLPVINNGAKLPVWVAATCTWGLYDDPNIPSMAEEMIWSESGGIATIAAARPSFAFENERFAKDVYRNLFYSGSDSLRSRLLGDAVVMSLGGRDNDQKYHLFGDVSLQLADPQHIVKIESISADTLKALSTVTIAGSVYDSGNNLIQNYDGKALIRVFDAVDSTRDEGNNRYTYPGGTIFKGIVTVNNGQVEGSFIVPKSIKYKNSRTGRVSIYAWSNNLRDAAGYNDKLLFLGTESGVNDTNGPKISFLFPDQPEFFDGDYVSSQPTLVIRLSDESGINLTGEVGHRIELTLDNNIKKDISEFFVYTEDSFTEGQLQYTLPALSSGRHQLTISAWDNLNNQAEEKINFTTTAKSELALAQVVNYPNPFDSETNFTFQFQSPASSAIVSIKIYTVSGRLIQELEDFAHPGFNKIYWDGRDRDGELLANGVYLYKIMVDDGEKTIEKIEKLAIAR